MRLLGFEVTVRRVRKMSDREWMEAHPLTDDLRGAAERVAEIRRRQTRIVDTLGELPSVPKEEKR